MLQFDVLRFRLENRAFDPLPKLPLLFFRQKVPADGNCVIAAIAASFSYEYSVEIKPVSPKPLKLRRCVLLQQSAYKSEPLPA